MSFALLKPSSGGGEISPSLWGRQDYEKVQVGASVMRNCFVSYRGPAYSRAGTALAGQMLTPASASSLPPVIRRFQFNIFQSYILEFGVDATGRPYMRVVANGAYVTEAAKTVTGATQANPCVLTVPAHGFANGDWVFAAGFGGMTQLNTRTFVVANVTASTFTLNGTFGDPVNSLGYGAFASGAGGGTVARIYTNFDPLYALADLPYLKVVQSADVMTLSCVNQQTGAEYPPVDLTRLAANNWSFATTAFASAIAAPATCTAVATVTASPATQYAFCVTAVDANGEESVASPIANVVNSVDIATTAGSLVVTWGAVAGAVAYNVYMAPPSYDTAVPIGASFGFIGESVGNQFVNTNIVPDFTKTPPLHNNPFARGQVIGATQVAGGSGYAQATTTAAVTSATGSGAVLVPVVVSAAVVAIIVQNAGQGYQASDTIVITDSGGGTGASFTIEVGPQTGTYPGVAGYFQQRRVYAYTLNNPDTEFFSQTGAFTNFDSSSPPVDSDAITLTPWGLQVNGVQWLQPTQNGLITMTGLSSWLVAGSTGAGSTLTPSSESALEQESYGFSPTVKPIKINYAILYVSPLGTAARDEQFDFYTGGFIGSEISILSNHLFENFQIVQWAWAQEPYKLVWATRDDGKFLSCTYLKEEKLIAWSRHDTNGLVAGNEIATEPPVDAPYFVAKRFIVGKGQWAYFLERMDNRIGWTSAENVWCVDCGLSLAQPTPNATLTAAAAEGPGTVTGAVILVAGAAYSDPSARVVDPAGTGTGAVVTLTQVGGGLASVTVAAPGGGYSPGTMCVVSDPTGDGGTVELLVSQNVQFDSSTNGLPVPVFGASQPGDVIRVGGGQAVLSQVVSASQVLAAITVPIVQTIPNDPNKLPVPAAPGDWTITTPVTTLANLGHLEGMQVYGKADGADIPLTTVVNGMITLPQAASAVIVGLPFIAQVQSMHVEINPTVQGKRKAMPGATIRLEKSRGVQVGCNRPVASTLPFQQEIPWTDLEDVKDYAIDNVPAAAIPLFTGDKFQPLTTGWQNWNGWEAAPGFVCAQQTTPNPMNVLAFVPQYEFGDPNG
jgi:hypothetical protein